MKKLKELGPIIGSIVAVIISLYSLYMTHIKPAKIDFAVGENININYFQEGNLGLTLPVSFSNSGASIATIKRVAVLVQEPGSNEGYLLEPLFYQRIDEKGNFIHDSTPGPIVVPPKSTVTKQVLLRSSFERVDEFLINKPGLYKLTFLGWIAETVKPELIDSFSIDLTEQVISELSDLRTQKISRTIVLRQSKWRKWSAHRLTEIEVNALIKGTY